MMSEWVVIDITYLYKTFYNFLLQTHTLPKYKSHDRENDIRIKYNKLILGNNVIYIDSFTLYLAYFLYDL